MQDHPRSSGRGGRWSPLTLNYTKKKGQCVWGTDAERKTLFARAGDLQKLPPDRTFGDFVPRFDWRFTPGGSVAPNGGGVVVRSQGVNAAGLDPQGVEIDLRADQSEEKGMGTGCFLTCGTELSSHRGKAGGQKQRHLGRLREPPARPAGGGTRARSPATATESRSG